MHNILKPVSTVNMYNRLNDFLISSSVHINNLTQSLVLFPCIEPSIDEPERT